MDIVDINTFCKEEYHGFASGIARNLVIFIVFELFTGFGTYYLAKSKKKSFA